jgi:Ca2+-binding EF-hand superfamily protein
MKRTSEAYSLCVKLTRNGVRRVLKELQDSTQDNKIEVCVNICNQRKEFTFREFCERLGIEYI